MYSGKLLTISAMHNHYVSSDTENKHGAHKNAAELNPALFIYPHQGNYLIEKPTTSRNPTKLHYKSHG